MEEVISKGESFSVSAKGPGAVSGTGSRSQRIAAPATSSRPAITTYMQPMTQTDIPVSTQPESDPAIAAALGRIPSGLFVVAWREDEADRSMLASWVMQAGFAPPLVSIAVAASRDLLAALDRNAPFVVSVLGESQRSLLARFGKPAADAFDGLAVHRAASGVAALANAAAWMECRPVTRAAHGDHVVVLAEVVSGAAADGLQPLVHVRKNGLRY